MTHLEAMNVIGTALEAGRLTNQQLTSAQMRGLKHAVPEQALAAVCRAEIELAEKLTATA